MDKLEELCEPSVYPPGTKQQLVTRLFETLIDGLQVDQPGITAGTI